MAFAGIISRCITSAEPVLLEEARTFAPSGDGSVNRCSSFRCSPLAVTSLGIALSSGPYQRYDSVCVGREWQLHSLLHRVFRKETFDIQEWARCYSWKSSTHPENIKSAAQIIFILEHWGDGVFFLYRVVWDLSEGVSKMEGGKTNQE